MKLRKDILLIENGIISTSYPFPGGVKKTHLVCHWNWAHLLCLRLTRVSVCEYKVWPVLFPFLYILMARAKGVECVYKENDDKKCSRTEQSATKTERERETKRAKENVSQ